jgi:hypothetical protein
MLHIQSTYQTAHNEQRLVITDYRNSSTDITMTLHFRVPVASSPPILAAFRLAPAQHKYALIKFSLYYM